MNIKNSLRKIAFFIAIIATTSLLTAKSVSAQSWYDANWSYRRAITVTNPGAITLTEYQTKITLNSSFNFSLANFDGSDIRITTDDGTTEIPYWIEDWNNGTSATLWVKIPSIPTSGGTIYVYYGNPGATSVSDGHSTFRFYEDFESWAAPELSGWEDKANLPDAIADQTAAVFNGNIYSMGGYSNGPTDPQTKNFEYVPSTNTWSVKTPMPTARWGMVAVEYNGKIFVFGGSNTVYTEPGILKNEVYDPLTDSWDVTKSDIPEGLAGMGIMGVSYGSKIHLFRFGNHYEYDPSNDTYTQKASVPTPRVWCTCAIVGSKIYLIGGDNGVSATSVNEVYDILTETWVTKRSLPDGLWGATRENPVIDGKIYVTHGIDGGSFYRTNYMYDPVTDIWEINSPANHERDGAACAVINNKLYVIGGRADHMGPYGLSNTEVYDPILDVEPWSSSGTNYVFADISAKYKGNYGIVVEQQSNDPVEQYFKSKVGFGDSYALDFEWNMTDALGSGSEPRPQGFVTLSENDPDASVYLYNSNNIPSLEWYNGNYQQLQTTSWNNWHKITIVRNGVNSAVTFDGVPHSPLSGYTRGGAGRIKFGIYFATKQFLDNVRIRKWGGLDPSTVVGSEQHLAPPAAPILIAPANASIGVSSSPTFVWNASETATSYHLQISADPGFLFVYNMSGITTTSATFSGLSNNATYFWRVNASNDREAGDWSTVWSFTTCSNPPTIYAGPDQNVCTTANTATMAGYSYTNATGATWSGGSGSWNGDVYTPDVADINAGSITLTYTTNTASPCGDVSDNMVITFVPAPVVTWVTIFSNQCVSSTSYMLTGGLPEGGTYSGVGVSGNNFDASLAGVGTHSLTYTYLDPSTQCYNSAINSIIVNPLPSVQAGTYGPVCIDAADIILGGSPEGGIWTGTGVSGAGPYVFDPSLGTQTLTYTYTDVITSCVNFAQTTIMVNSVPTVIAGTYGPVCSDATDITLGGTPAGGIWTGTGVSGTGPYVFDPSSGTQTLTYTYTDVVNFCGVGSDQTSITVNSLPTVTAGTYGPVCIDAADITLGGTPTGGVWTGTGVSGTGPYIFDPSSGTQILTYTYTDGITFCVNSDQTTIAVNPLPTLTAGTYGPVCIDAAEITLGGTPAGGIWTGTGVSGTGPYVFDPSAGTQTLIYTYTDEITFCVNSDQATITVNPLPTVTAGTYGPVCIDAADIMLGGIPAGGIWTGTGVSGTGPYVFDPSAGTQTLIYTYTDEITFCVNSDQATITVNPLPTVTAGTYGPVCIDASDITLSGTPAGGIWTGTGVSGTGPYVFDPSAGTQTLIYTYTDEITFCVNSDQATITVNPLPTVTAGTYGPVCIDAADITLGGTPTGGVWTGIGVSGTGPYVFDPSSGTQTLIYTYTDVITSCVNSDQVTIIVNPLPTVSAGTYPSMGISSNPVALIGTPLGGIFSGSGVTGNLFYPASAGIGNHAITYTYSDNNGCTNTDITTIIVYDDSKTLNLSSVLLEGLYNGAGTMRQANDEFGPHWSTGIADHITVELHDAANYAIIAYTATDVPLTTSGAATVTVPGNFNGSYYITIKHRNSLETTTADFVSFAGTTINQSFGTPANVYGNNLGLTIDSYYVIYVGDVNQDGIFDTDDFKDIDNNSFVYLQGYIVTDINGDGYIDTNDFLPVDNNTFNYISTSHP